jgi:hypothetical protein
MPVIEFFPIVDDTRGHGRPLAHAMTNVNPEIAGAEIS